eukprot:TRINITY_DN2029_c0_g1_i2.p1 TRINITY_DN2029_c0_g1~~TRINITY_DN2029_c0_g1_i2.p1  ORF type:complete len:140 (-),score=22.76 TRINITY_DN2029_c0_g1_i2:201-620(-)
MISMAAPRGGSGTYTQAQIQTIYKTAYTSFRAAVAEGELAVNDEKTGDHQPYVVIHTGNWGCGAFGGNLSLMALLQCLAARTAGVDKLVYHTFNKIGSDGFQKGLKELTQLEQSGFSVDQILEACANNSKFIWGTSDGN